MKCKWVSYVKINPYTFVMDVEMSYRGQNRTSALASSFSPRDFIIKLFSQLLLMPVLPFLFIMRLLLQECELHFGVC